MPSNREYAERLRTATELYLRKPVPIGEGDADATVELFETKGRSRILRENDLARCPRTDVTKLHGYPLAYPAVDSDPLSASTPEFDTTAAR